MLINYLGKFKMPCYTRSSIDEEVLIAALCTACSLIPVAKLKTAYIHPWDDEKMSLYDWYVSHLKSDAEYNEGEEREQALRALEKIKKNG